MKYLFSIALLFSFMATKAQTQYLGGPTTLIYIRGSERVDTVIYLPINDTLFTPAQKGAVVFKGSNNILYIWDGIKWNKIPAGSITWGTITGTLTNQTDLISFLSSNYQAKVTWGYGLKYNAATATYDSATIRKVDTIVRVNDSTLQYVLNGRSYNLLVRGTAAGGISSLVFTVPTTIFNGPVTFSNSGGAWTGTMTLANQNPNAFLAGPSVGSPAAPTMRGIVVADLPLNIPNGQLQFPFINFALNGSGTDVGWSAATANLGSTQTLSVPDVSAVSRGVVTSTLYNVWNGKKDGFDSAFNNPRAYVTQASRKKLADSLGALIPDFTYAQDTTNTPYQYQNLSPNLQALLAHIFQMDTLFTLHVAMFGDSKALRDANGLKVILNKKFPMNGPGYISPIWDPVYYVDMLPTNPTDSGWTIQFQSAGGIGPGLASALSSGPHALSMTPTSDTSQFDLWDHIDVQWWGATGGGSFDTYIDGVNVGSINTSTTAGFNITTFAASFYGKHSFKFLPTSEGSAHNRFLGAKLYTNRPGILVNNLAQGGQKSTDPITGIDSATWVDECRATGVDVIIYYIGTNDLVAGVNPVTTFTSNVQGVINRLKAMNPLADIILLGTPDVDFVGTYTALAYNQATQRLALSNRVSFCDLNKVLGYSWEEIYARGLYQVDRVHENEYGSVAVGSAILNAFPMVAGKTIHRPNWSMDGFGNVKVPLIQTLTNLGGSTTGFTTVGNMAINTISIPGYEKFFIRGNNHLNAALSWGTTVADTGATVLGMSLNNESLSPFSPAWAGINLAFDADPNNTPFNLVYRNKDSSASRTILNFSREGHVQFNGTPVVNQPLDAIFNGVTGMRIPFGTTAQRDAEVDGSIRINSDDDRIEYWSNGQHNVATLADIAGFVSSQWTDIPTGHVGIAGRVSAGSSTQVPAMLNSLNNSYGSLVGLEVAGTSSNTSNPRNDFSSFVLVNSDQTNGNAASIRFVDVVSPASQEPVTGIEGIFTNHQPGSLNGRGDIAIYTLNTDVYQKRVRIFSSGNFAVGTNPTDIGRAVLQLTPSTSPISGLADIWLGGRSGAPSSLLDGLLWRDTVAHTLNFRENGITKVLSSAFANPMTTVGDIIVGGSAGTPTRLAAGSNGSLLTISSGTPAYTTALPTGTTATTPSPSDNSTKVSTTAYVDAAVAYGAFKPTATPDGVVITSATMDSCYFTRVGPMVSFKISGTVNIASAALSGSVQFTLPVATATATQQDCGVGALQSGTLNGGSADLALSSSKIVFTVVPGNTGSAIGFTVTGMYHTY